MNSINQESYSNINYSSNCVLAYINKNNSSSSAIPNCQQRPGRRQRPKLPGSTYATFEAIENRKEPKKEKRSSLVYILTLPSLL